MLKVGETFLLTKEKLKDFDTWILKFLKKTKTRIKIIDILSKDKLPNINSAKGFIISGSHEMVTDELTWSLLLEKYIKKISKTNIPLLGICYGHQLIAKALGGKSDFNKNGKEIGIVKIKNLSFKNKDPLLKNFPKKFDAFETHYQTVIKLPAKAKILAKNSKDNTQAARFESNIWGVQFHPEFDKEIMKEYILNQKETIKDLRSCDISNTVLKNFSDIVEKKV
ncbi:glutamine amidotransferase [Arcobacter peruensis]|uniref:glutamine amidotransferase n=1 Tax=Arcobacter peruensis TaxID=2320140 RepID=UPI001D1819CC|nr:glutamine amidotransferase [Arcobacter peruensis]